MQLKNLGYILTFFFMPVFAYAATIPAIQPIKLNTCSSAPNWMVTTNIVNCVRSQLENVMVGMSSSIGGQLVPFTLALFVLALSFLGVRIVMGVDDFRKEMALFIMRFALVIFFLTELQPGPGRIGLVLLPFGIVDTGVKIVSTGLTGSPAWSPWNLIDVCLGYLFGYGPNFDNTMNNFGQTPFRGLIGIIGTSFMSNLVGILVFVMGLLSILSLIYFGLRAVFSYLAALVMIAFMMIVSPIFLPLAIFHYTSERFVKKWLDLLIACIINPIVVFAFLAIFLPVIDNIINLFYSATFSGVPGGVDFSPFYKSTKLFSWNIPTDPALWQAMNTQLGGEQSQKLTSLQNFMGPSSSSDMQMIAGNFPITDFGPQQVQMMQMLIGNFLGLFLVTYLMLMLLDGVPQIADGIARVRTGLTFEGLPFASELKNLVAKVRGAMAGTG